MSGMALNGIVQETSRGLKETRVRRELPETRVPLETKVLLETKEIKDRKGKPETRVRRAK